MHKPRLPVLCANALHITEEIEALHAEQPHQTMVALVVDDEALRSMGVPPNVSRNPLALYRVREELIRIASEPSVLCRLKTAALSAILSPPHPVPMEAPTT